MINTKISILGLILISMRPALAENMTPIVLPKITIENSRILLPALNELDHQAAQKVENIDNDKLNLTDRFEDALALLTGMQPSISTAGIQPAFVARGFKQSNFYINAHQDINRYFVRDPITVQKMNVQYGHSGVLLGQGAPGASVNSVIKQPESIPHLWSQFSLDQEGWARTEFDLNPSALLNDTLRFRIVGAIQQGETWQHNVNNNRNVILASSTWDNDENGTWKLELEYMQNQRPFSFGTVRVGNEYKWDQSYVGDQSSADRRYSRQALYWDYPISEYFNFHALIQNVDVKRDETLVGFWSIVNPTTLSGYYTQYHDDFDQLNAKVALGFQFSGLGLHHIGELGFEYNTQNIDFKGVQNIAGFKLDVNQPQFPDVALLKTTPRFNIEKQNESAFYFQDVIQLTKASQFIVGARTSHFTADVDTGRGFSRLADINDISMQLGWQHTIRPNIDFFANMNNSFVPVKGLDREQQFLPPLESTQYELGLNTASLDKKINIQSSVYQIQQNNLTARDPLMPTALQAIGSVRTRGLELSGSLEWHDYVMTLRTAWLRAENTKKTIKNQGDHPVGIAQKMASAMISKKWPADMSTWLGVLGVGAAPGDVANSFYAPGYAILNMGASVQCAKGAVFTLQLNNMLDTRYVMSITDSSDVYQGNRRNLKLSMKFDL